MARAKNGLTIKQDKFARLAATTGNLTLAAKQAGYSKRSAPQIAHENMMKHEVAEEVARHRLRLSERLDASRERIVQDTMHDAESASIAGNSVNIDMTGAHLEALRALTSQHVTDINEDD